MQPVYLLDLQIFKIRAPFTIVALSPDRATQTSVRGYALHRRETENLPKGATFNSLGLQGTTTL